MLKELYTTQAALNDAIGWPPDYEDLEQLARRNAQGFNRTALVTELGEALQATKPLWAWWRKPDAAPYDRQLVADEVVDVLFFLLTHFDLMQHSAYAEARFKGALPIPVLPDDVEERREILRIALDQFELSALLGEELHIAAVDEIRRMGYDDEFILPVLIRSMLSLTSGPDYSTHQIFATIVRLFGTWEILGYDWDDFWVQYHAKALVNLNRWYDSGILVIDDEAYDRLRNRIAVQAGELRPIPDEADLATKREFELQRAESALKIAALEERVRTHAARNEDPDAQPFLN